MFEIADYQKKSAFSSFLPGIAGEMGIPIWCFYVNRGQGVCSFGVNDKEHPIMEFSPAHVAYQTVSTTGFRTFIKLNGEYFEPFRPTDEPGGTMGIDMNLLELSEKSHGLSIDVSYFTLPGEKVGALMRTLTITNMSGKSAAIELLDGMPALLTYGTTSNIMKVMTQTHKAWMQVEDVDSRLPYYRLRASSEDTTEVKEIQEGNFAFAVDESGELLPIVVDPELAFSYNLSLSEATGFREHPLRDILASVQQTSNNVPTALFAAERTLEDGESIVLREVYGMAGSKELLRSVAQRLCSTEYFDGKREEAVRLARKLTDIAGTKSSDNVFDEYCRQTCLDNILRGGYPIELGGKPFYVYSRKHGDIERDYNFFVMTPEYYSQGNANYRDVNQNRRSDPLFRPYVGDYNIKLFMNLMQLDGNNPLVVDRASSTIQSGAVGKVTALITKGADRVEALLSGAYTPGKLATLLDSGEVECSVAPREVLETAIANSDCDTNAVFSEGYWTDHWTYNLDLIESYLAVFPEKEEALLFDDMSYRYYEPRAVVRPRSQRYTKTPKGIRQYNAIREREAKYDWVRKADGGEYRTNLASKLVVLALNKTASLDPLGMGIEMEAGKPGWYDALNGLPGLFGSSTAETCELVRLLDYMIDAFGRMERSVKIPVECADLMTALAKHIDALDRGKLDRFGFWDAVNTDKESYRLRVENGIGGAETSIGAAALVETLKSWRNLAKDGMERACGYGELPTCYFFYDVTDYEERDGAIIPKSFKETALPPFLEGVVRYMKTPNADITPDELYDRVRRSPLYDEGLSMYKVNASLADSSYELGRCRAFTPGWLENESIWLHMEYKYLLGLLRAGLYNEFFHDFHGAGIPFLSPEEYGRSTLENSSFIASSANPNPAIRGKGFVARLSGSTAEFMQMWQIMMFGEHPFVTEGDELVFMPRPALPGYLMEKGSIECTLLGQTGVTYHASKPCALVPGSYTVKSIVVEWNDGSQESFGDRLRGNAAQRVRALEAKRIEVEIDV